MIAIVGGVALSGALVTMLRSSDGDLSTPIVVPPALSSASAGSVSSPVGVHSAPVVTPGSAEGLILFGVLGGRGDRASAIIGAADGSQHLVRVGRAVAPGVILSAVKADSVVLMVGDRQVRLSLADAGGRSSLTALADDAAGSVATVSAEGYQRRAARDETTEFRLGFVPRIEDGATTGFAIRPDADMPIFKKAGLRAGDIVYLVNGRAFASEREIDALSREIGLSNTLVIGFERAGQRQEARIDINK